MHGLIDGMLEGAFFEGGQSLNCGPTGRGHAGNPFGRVSPLFQKEGRTGACRVSRHTKGIVKGKSFAHAGLGQRLKEEHHIGGSGARQTGDGMHQILTGYGKGKANRTKDGYGIVQQGSIGTVDGCGGFSNGCADIGHASCDLFGGSAKHSANGFKRQAGSDGDAGNRSLEFRYGLCHILWLHAEKQDVCGPFKFGGRRATLHPFDRGPGYRIICPDVCVAGSLKSSGDGACHFAEAKKTDTLSRNSHTQARKGLCVSGARQFQRGASGQGHEDVRSDIL